MNDTSVQAGDNQPGSRASIGSTAGPHAAKGVCIVCGSALVLAFWCGHPDNRKVHCNDCGSEVTALMHAKKQPNNILQ